MDHESPIQLAEPSYPEALSFDSNKFERVLIFERLNEIGSKIYTENRVTHEEAREILDSIDKLADMGYFFTEDAESNKTAADLVQRGIAPERQNAIEYDFVQQNIEYIDILLENICSAGEIPPGFIEDIRKKLIRQLQDGISGPGRILQALQQFEDMYPRD